MTKVREELPYKKEHEKTALFLGGFVVIFIILIALIATGIIPDELTIKFPKIVALMPN